MKKTIILAIAAIVLATGASAQKKIEFGVKAGFNMAQEFAEEGSTDVRIGLNAGIFAEFFISNRFGIQPELVYSMQGGKDGDIIDKFDYVNLPVILKIYVLKRDLSIDVGPQVGYMISAKANSRDIYDRIDNKLDVAIGFGSSYKFAERFHAGLRYNIGFTKLVDNMDNRNGVIQIFAGIRF